MVSSLFHYCNTIFTVGVCCIERPRSGHLYDPIGNLDLDPAPRPKSQRHSRGQKSWWRSAFARISQSGTELETNAGPADGLTPAVSHRTGRRASWLRRSRQLSPTHQPERHDFEDPPPSSVIQGYRGSRERPYIEEDSHSINLNPATPPMFVPQPVLRVESPPEQSPSSPPRQLKRKAPLPSRSSPQIDPRLLSPLAPTSRASHSDYADSLFGRVFPVSDTSHATEVLRSGPASSQSHQSGVRLGGIETVAVTGSVMAQAPVVIQPGPPKVNSQERLVEMPTPAPKPEPTLPAVSLPSEPGPSMPIPIHTNVHGTPDEILEIRPSKRRSSHIRDSAQHKESSRNRSSSSAPQRSRGDRVHIDLRRDSRVPTGRTSYPMDPHAVRRERVVLPSPLAPVATSSSSPSPPRHRDRQHDRYEYQFTSSPVEVPSFAGSLPPSSSPGELLQPTHRLAGRRSLPATSAAPQPPMPHPTSLQPSQRSPTSSRPRHPALSSSLPPSEASPNATAAAPIPQLRRSSHNAKRHSYSQEQSQGRRSSGDRQSRRLSAPLDGLPGVQPGNAPSTLHPLRETSADHQ